MAFVGNLLWFVFGGGIIAWLMWFMAGILFAITIIGIPFAKAAFRISVFAAFPFGLGRITSYLTTQNRDLHNGFNFVPVKIGLYEWCLLELA